MVLYYTSRLPKAPDISAQKVTENLENEIVQPTLNIPRLEIMKRRMRSMCCIDSLVMLACKRVSIQHMGNASAFHNRRE